MKSSDSFEAADVVDTDMQFLYSDGEYWHFMHQESFEQAPGRQERASAMPPSGSRARKSAW